MRSRVVRLALTLLAVGALAAAAYLSWQIETRTTRHAADTRDTQARLTDASRLAAELRAAQQAYVAAGQSEQFWISKVTTATAGLQEAIGALRAAPLSSPGQAALERAGQAVDEFARLDRRAREYAAGGQKLLASDVIFSDGLEATGQISTALDEVAAAETSNAAANREQATREQTLYAGGAAALALVALLLLAPLPKREPEAPALPAFGPAVVPDTRDTFDLDAALLPRDTPVVAPVSAPPPAAGLSELGDVADVCSQLARLTDTSTLPALLQRTALALDASGVVLWLSDPSATELTAVAAHGYPAQVLSRMGAMSRDAENVTAAAFRTGLLQIVKADAMSHGAIAAPLVSPAGPIGVLSAEVRHDGETQPARLAIATIVASQLATLVTPAARTDAARSAGL